MPDEQMRQAARASARRLLSRREHSAYELVHKLHQRGYALTLVEAIVAELAREGWVSDARYAAALVYERRSRGYGPLRIRAELSQHGVEAALVESHLRCDDAEWIRLAQRCCVRRFGDPANASLKERERRFRFLLNRGFTREQIRKALQGIGARTNDRSCTIE
ncbi:MAG: regulatory protein RecX [Nitrococcus mobilis]|nr:regulatory protein RecX [Nitrococcus mobilis]